MMNTAKNNQAQFALQESESRFRHLANNAPMMVWMTEADGTCTFLSESWYEFTGQTPETGLGFGWLNAVHPDDRKYSEQTFLNASRQVESFRLDYRLRRKDGEYRWAIDSAKPRLSDTGEFLGYIGSVIDITDRKQAEEALRESEEKYRTLFNSIDEGFCICEMLVDENGKPYDYRWLEINPMFELHTGLKNPVGKTALQLIPNLEQHWVDIYGKVALTGEPVRFTQGSEVMGRWFDVYSFRVGQPEKHQFAILFTDITVRKRTETALLESQERLQLARIGAGLGIHDYNLETGHIEWDERLRDLWGVPDDLEITFDIFMAGIHPDDQEATRKAVDRALNPAGDGNYYAEYRVIHRIDGVVRWIAAAGKAFFEQGQAVRLIGTVQDITEPKRSEQRKYHLRALTTALASAATEEEVLQAIAASAFAALGAERGGIGLLTEDKTKIDLVGYNYPALPETIREQIRSFPLATSSPMTDVILTGNPLWIENLAQYQELYPEYVQLVQEITQSHALICLPLNSPDGAIGGIGVSFKQPQIYSEAERSFAISIAEVCAQALVRARLYETERQAREEAEEANSLKLQFMGMISHELRTPIASIKGFISTLLATDIVWPPEQQREFLKIAEDEADKLTELVEQLLNLARVQARSLPILAEVTSMEKIIAVAAAQLETLTSDHQLHFEGIKQAPPVMADAMRIAQVLVNLVGNAVKFSPRGSVIVIAACAEQDFVQVDVSDQGRGIPVHAHDYIFEAFRQITPDDRERGKGAGLGLAICKGFVEAHGGRIWVQDREGPGTTISFTLPVANTGELLPPH
jgi:PAS domain S-box-containing protein